VQIDVKSTQWEYSGEEPLSQLVEMATNSHAEAFCNAERLGILPRRRYIKTASALRRTMSFARTRTRRCNRVCP